MLPMHDIMSEKLWPLQLLWDHAAARGGSNQLFNFTWLYPSSREGHVSSIPHDAPLSWPRLAKLQEHAPIDHHFVAPFVLRDEGGRMPVHSSHARIPNPPDQWNMSFYIWVATTATKCCYHSNAVGASTRPPTPPFQMDACTRGNTIGQTE
jgi:hypothetical protein